MTTSAAQDEFNELLRDKDRETRHPEDRDHHSDVSSQASAGADDDYKEKIDTDDELDIPKDMRANYYMPSLRSEANTGPKGVIADAQAFEQARKQAKRFTLKKGFQSTGSSQYSVKVWHDDKAPPSDDEEEDNFMKEWRATRLKELQNVGQRIRSRTTSPSRRIYGNFPLVDPEGYLDAIDKSGPDTTVVVFIYSEEQAADPKSFTAAILPRMLEVVKRNDTTRFVRFSNIDAEMPEEVVPAVLAYKRGEKFADIIPLDRELPKDDHLTAVSLETALRRYRIL